MRRQYLHLAKYQGEQQGWDPNRPLYLRAGCANPGMGTSVAAADALQSDNPRRPGESAHISKLVDGNLAFALDLYHILLTMGDGADLFFLPP